MEGSCWRPGLPEQETGLERHTQAVPHCSGDARRGVWEAWQKTALLCVSFFLSFFKSKRYLKVSGRYLSGGFLKFYWCKPPRAELRGMLHPRRKSPDTGKANKMEREEALLPFSNSAPTTSHITNLKTNYLEPDILKNLPLQLSECRDSK